MKLLVFCVFLACVSLAWTIDVNQSDEKPGLTVRLKRETLDLMKDHIVNFMNSALKTSWLFADSVNIQLLGYEVNNLNVESLDFDFGNVVILTSPTEGLELQMINASLSLNIDDLEIITERTESNIPNPPRLSGSMNAAASGIDFSPSLKFGKNADGYLKVIPGSCSAFIKELKIRLRDTGNDLSLNYVIESFKNVIRKDIETLICTSARLWVENNRFLKINNFKYAPEIMSNVTPIMVHFECVYDPMVTDEDLTIYLNGSCIPFGNPEQTFPFEALHIPNLTPTSQMARASISEYSINTMFYSLWKQNWLNVKFSSEQIISATGISAAVLLSYISPDIIHEERPMQIQLIAPKAPAIDLTRNTVDISGNIMLKVDIVLANGELERAIDGVVTDFSVSGYAVTENHLITGKITKVDIGADPQQGLFAQNVNKLFKGILSNYLLFTLNELIKIAEYQLPIPKYLMFMPVNLSLDIKEGAFEVGI